MNHLRTRPRITLDVSPLFETYWTGIPVFTRRLVQSLLRHGGVDLEFMFQLTRIPTAAMMAAIKAGTGVFLRAKFESEAAFGWKIVDRSACLLYPSVKNSFGVAAREASTVHDMSTLFMPEFHEPTNIAYHLDKLALELATDDVVFCVSEASQAALRAAFPSVAHKTRVVYQYADWPESFPLMERNLPPLRLGRYAVVVGTIEPRKNLGLLLRALATPELRHSSLRFIVIGRKGWKVDQFMAELPVEAQERMLFSGFVSEFTKYRLIRGAEFLILPSVYEGFGIPALEAMSLGKPVLASWSSSLPEVIGDAGVFFDPLSVTDFAAAFATIADQRKLTALAPVALANSAAFNWQRMAAPVVEWAGARRSPARQRATGGREPGARRRTRSASRLGCH
jgi:glycosyltransferase involved in cell wall biosynthesis